MKDRIRRLFVKLKSINPTLLLGLAIFLPIIGLLFGVPAFFAGGYQPMGLFGPAEEQRAIGARSHPEKFMNNPVMAWVDNGRQLAFTFDDELYLVDAEGNETRRLSRSRDDDYFAYASAPSAAPGSKWLAYARYRQGYNIYDWQVARLDLDDGEAVRLTGPEKPRRLHQNSPDALLPLVSPDGEKIAAILAPSRMPTDRLYVMKPDGSEQRSLGDSVPFPHRAAGWSPDSQRLWLLAPNRHDQRNSDLYVVSLEGGEPVVINRNIDSYPSWSPDSSNLIYMKASNPDPNTGERFMRFYLAAADGSSNAVVFDEPEGSKATRYGGRYGYALRQIAWSPDGSRLVFASEITKYGSHIGQRLYSVDLASGKVHSREFSLSVDDIIDERYPPGLRLLHFAWTPDSKRLAVSRGGAEDMGPAGSEFPVVFTVDRNLDDLKILANFRRNAGPLPEPEHPLIPARYAFSEIGDVVPGGSGQRLLVDSKEVFVLDIDDPAGP